MEKIAKKYSFDDVLLVPKESVLTSRSEADLSTYLTNKIKLKMPIVSADMDTVTESKMAIALGKLGGVGVIHRFNDARWQAGEVAKVNRQNLLVGAAVGVKEEDLDRADKLLKAGANFLVVDIAHGHSKVMEEMLKKLRQRFQRAEIVAGNIATAEGVGFLAKLGVSAVKVGIGPGSACTTRIVTGFGVPQLSAIMECSAEARKYNLPVIADGGIESSGSLVKALAAGGSTVMLGNLLAGTDEAPGRVVTRLGKKYKVYRGMASREASLKRYQKNNWDLSQYKAVSEGIEGLVSYRGRVEEVIEKLLGGLRSGISYGGARSINELQQNAQFIEITSAGLRESFSHDLIQSKND